MCRELPFLRQEDGILPRGDCSSPRASRILKIPPLLEDRRAPACHPEYKSYSLLKALLPACLHPSVSPLQYSLSVSRHVRQQKVPMVQYLLFHVEMFSNYQIFSHFLHPYFNSLSAASIISLIVFSTEGFKGFLGSLFIIVSTCFLAWE